MSKDVMKLPVGIDELFTEFGMSDLSEFHDALEDTLALELGDTVFGNHEVDVAAAGSGHAHPFAEMGYDARYFVASSCGGKGNTYKEKSDGKTIQEGAVIDEFRQ